MSGRSVAIEPRVDPGPPLDVAARRPTSRIRWQLLTGAALVAANVVVLSDAPIAFVGAALGWWLIVVNPVYVLATTRTRSEVSATERVVFSLGAVVLLLVVGGLALDVVLPHVGVARPLDCTPVLVAVDLLNVALLVRRVRRGTFDRSWWSPLRSLTAREGRILTLATCCVPLVVAGANRLNNDQNDTVTLVGLGMVVITFVLVLLWRTVLRDSVISAVTYLLGLSLLLSTSLRGWFVTGHDIQREYRVFQLTKAHGVWNINSFHDAYNACLSITILPTAISQLVRVDDPYVYKVFFQLVFAACPVMVYLLARRYWSKRIAILSVIYFVGFPTFFTDMPFLNRQEIAFLFLGLAYLAMTRHQWSVMQRTVVLTLCGVGVGLSHYSTMYVFVGTLVVAWTAERLTGLGRFVLRHREAARPETPKPKHRTAPRWADATRSVGLVAIVVLAGVTFLWGGVITRTTTGLTATVEQALPQFFGTSGGAHSNDSSYSLLPTSQSTPQQLLDQYHTQTLHDRKVDDPGTYLSLSKAGHLPTRAVETPAMPVTRAGSLLSDIHVSVPALNDLVRGLAAKGEQVFVVVGLLVLGLVGWRRRQIGPAFYFLSIGSVFMVGAVTVLPGLSVSYGLLRAFQQALFLIAPILVIGSITVFKPLGRVWSHRVAEAVALVFLVSTIGIMPQVLGGYEAQLNLNNSGVYYNEYYQQPQEVAAIDWLGNQPATLPVGVQAESTTDRYAFTSPTSVNGSQLITDIFPTLLRKGTWVVLGYATVHSGTATTQYDGDLITYRYPLGPLKNNDDLVYDNGGARIYK